MSFEGFFWYPRTLFGIEEHMFAFYDQPELMKQMNQDNADYMIATLNRLEKEDCLPTFVVFAEDMSYNNGPMISEDLFDEFMLPYYQQVMPVLEKLGITPIIDSDGDVTDMVPWFQKAGIRGILPLEFQAGVDANNISEMYPEFIILGNYNKLVMDLGKDAVRAEFERLLPVMRNGRFIPSCDHQTPPAVSYEQYKEYIELLKEYSVKAAE